MRLRRLAVSLLLISSLATAAPVPTPKLLNAQIARLVELLRDSYASGYPEAALVQEFAIGEERKLALALFTIEGFGGGNNHTQFLAVFEHESGIGAKAEQYRLIDVIPIGGKGSRSILQLQAEARQDAATSQVHFSIPALKNGPNDALNFPGKPEVIRLVLDKGRLSELNGG